MFSAHRACLALGGPGRWDLNKEGWQELRAFAQLGVGLAHLVLPSLEVQQGLDPGGELVPVKGLAQQAVGAAVHGLLAVLHGRYAGHKHHRGVGRFQVSPQVGQEDAAVLLRQDNVTAH
jgi:hypothetical protein